MLFLTTCKFLFCDQFSRKTPVDVSSINRAGVDESDEEMQQDKKDREERKRLKKEREKKERRQREAEEDVAVQAADLVAPALKQEDIQDKQQRFQFLKEKLKLEIDKRMPRDSTRLNSCFTQMIQYLS